MNVIQPLEQHYDLALVDAAESTWSYSDSTPAAQFHFHLAPIRSGEMLLCAPFKTGGWRLVAPVLDTAKRFLESNSMDKPLVLLPSANVSPFHAVALISHAAHRQYKTFDPQLHRATIVVLPVYQCELSGDESADLVQLIRQDFLPSLEWDRQPHPKVFASFDNPVLGMGSVDSVPKLAKLSDVQSELRRMENCDSAWLKVQNWIGETLLVDYKHGYLCQPEVGGSTINGDFETASKMIQSFCLEGVRPAGMHP